MTGKVAKRGRGRPKGSKNKSRIISGATVEDYCKLHNYNPTEFLIGVARGEEVHGIQWCPADIMRANAKLHDSIHHGKVLRGNEQEGEALDGQFSLVFAEHTADFALPGEAHAEGAAQVVREESLQRLGDSSQSGQDSIRDQ